MSSQKKALLNFTSGRVKVMGCGAYLPDLWRDSYTGRHVFGRTADTYNGARVYREVE